MPGYIRDTFDNFAGMRPRGGTAWTEKPYTVAASQSINYRDIVAKTSGANTIEQAIALPGSNSTGTASGGNLPILGVALASIVTNSAGVEANTGITQIRVAVFDDMFEVMLRIYNATAANSEFQDIAVFTPLQFQRWRGASASSWWYSLITTTTNGELVPTELYIGASASDDYGPVWCRANTLEVVRLG